MIVFAADFWMGNDGQIINIMVIHNSWRVITDDILSIWMYNVGKTIINQPFRHDLCHLFMVF